MDIELDRQRIINKFKRNNLFLNKPSLEMLNDHLRTINNPNKRLDEIIKKMNEMIIMQQQQLNESSLKLAIQLIIHKTQSGKSFSSYDKFIQNLKKWTIFYVSPYQTKQRFFVDKPDTELFKFQPQEYVKMNQNRFKAIKQYNQIQNKIKNAKGYIFIGILFQKFSMGRTQIMLQNEINEIQLIFPNNFNLQCFLIPGCTYIAQGEFKNKDLQLTLNNLSLPLPLPSIKTNLFHAKLKLVCDNISLSKNDLNFTIQDFKSHQVIYNKSENKGKPIFIFGNVKINKIQISKIKKLIKVYPYKAECIILLIMQGQHQQMDLMKQLQQNIPIYIVPNINSEGPRILPKVPILKQFYNAKVVTNPARFSIQGTECILLNYPIVKNLLSKSLIPQQFSKLTPNQMAKRVYSFLSSQNNVGVANKIYWKQSQYFNISTQDLIFVCDKACPQVQYTEGKGGLVSIGNFQVDGDFICFMPQLKTPIQLSKLQ